MGRRKKGDFSREAMLLKVNDQKDVDAKLEEQVTKNKSTENKAKKAESEKDIGKAKKTEAEKDIGKAKKTKVVKDIEKPQTVDKEEVHEEVFEDDAKVEYEDDLSELTRLMSLCEVEDNLEDFEEQLNLAGT